MGIPGLIYPSTLDSGVLERDLPVAFALTIALVMMAYGLKGDGRINRIEGAILLCCFVGYQVLLYFTELQ
jgi:cation:H+ antiporter